MNLKNEKHKYLLEKLESLINLEHSSKTEQLHRDLWTGKPLAHLPCIIGGFRPEGWPQYSFSE
jgi:hypothetical protein